MIAKNRTKSAWTPLSNEETNNKLFEERGDLIGKWYQKWTDEQRRKVLEDVLSHSRKKQLEFVRDFVHEKVPPANIDFTRILPRVISVYVLSFLDPTSICRAAQLSWYWHDLCERDELWMPRCVRVGWYLPFTPSPFERGVWKRQFVENIKVLILMAPKKPPKLTLDKLNSRERQISKDKKEPGQVPWRGSDPVPKDTWRYNYLQNDEVVKDIQKMRKKKVYGKEVDSMVTNVQSKVKTGANILNTIQRSQSLSRLNAGITTATSSERPTWAQQRELTLTGTKSPQVNDGKTTLMRPGPVSPPPKTPKSAKSRPTTARTARDPPSQDLFPAKPWNVPTEADSDNE